MIDQVKIGGINYTIELINDLHTVDEKNTKKSFYGQIKYAASTIQLEQQASLDQQKSTLLHETLHGILNQAGDETDIEKQIVILGYGLYQVLRDNPKLTALIMEGIPCPTPSQT